MLRLLHTYEDIISFSNLLLAWKEFARGKTKKKDVQEFSFALARNLMSLHEDLHAGAYRHGMYEAFKVNDPKPRNIHKASVRDRVLHRAVYRTLYPFFDRLFITDLYSCRNDKGTHWALSRFRDAAYKVSKNHTRTCWILKCDIRKFFASIDHKILLSILETRIFDKQLMCLLSEIIRSFNSGTSGVGLPLGNLTSQLFGNVYVNEFDQYVKHFLKVKYYIRYADDFVFLSEDRSCLVLLVAHIQEFLFVRLQLRLHENKIFIKTFASGVDFLGWVHFPDHRVLRTTTKRRMFKKLEEDAKSERMASYLGLLSHGNTHKLQKDVTNLTSCAL